MERNRSRRPRNSRPSGRVSGVNVVEAGVNPFASSEEYICVGDDDLGNRSDGGETHLESGLLQSVLDPLNMSRNKRPNPAQRRPARKPIAPSQPSQPRRKAAKVAEPVPRVPRSKKPSFPISFSLEYKETGYSLKSESEKKMEDTEVFLESLFKRMGTQIQFDISVDEFGIDPMLLVTLDEEDTDGVKLDRAFMESLNWVSHCAINCERDDRIRMAILKSSQKEPFLKYIDTLKAQTKAAE